jgi:hypothetical protein
VPQQHRGFARQLTACYTLSGDSSQVLLELGEQGRGGGSGCRWQIADLNSASARRSGSWRSWGHTLQLPKRTKRSEPDEFEGHQVRLAER